MFPRCNIKTKIYRAKIKADDYVRRGYYCVEIFWTFSNKTLWKWLKGMWNHNASSKPPKIRVDNHIRFLCQNLKKKNIFPKKNNLELNSWRKYGKNPRKVGNLGFFLIKFDDWVNTCLELSSWKASHFCLAFLVVCSRNWKTLIKN